MQSNSVCSHTSDTKSDKRVAGVRFVYHECDYGPNIGRQSYYQLLIKITIAEKKKRIAKL